MNIAINTDYHGSTGSPEPRLKAMAKAGFTHVHWCHQWNTDFMYGDAEIAQIGKWLKEYGLTLLDIHGSVGPEKNWFSDVEYQRKAGVELVANRMRMLRQLDGIGTVMMHTPNIQSISTPIEIANVRRLVDNLRRSLDELMPLSKELNVPIAIENGYNDAFQIKEELFADYPPEFLGLCYDSGHGNMFDGRGLDNLDRNKERLMALHLNDNDGLADLHQPPFYGTLDWERLANILKASPYPRPMSFELAMRRTPYDENIDAFIEDAYARCARVTRMVRGD
ncbi:MAG: sugar phosphate isomerase/epimerase [Victivallales bacterium]|nr:sugar phosphate isomerase/epimerase [Victivallales bacterium]